MQGKWVAYCMMYEGSNNGSSERDQMTGQAKRVCESLAKPQKAGMLLSKASWIWASCESLAANDKSQNVIMQHVSSKTSNLYVKATVNYKSK